MTKKIIATLVALGIVGGIAASANAHQRPRPAQTATEQPFSGATFWEQQQKQSGQ